jgi:hypothetical protein
VRRAAGVLALGCALACACSREDDQPKQVVDLRPGYARLASAAADAEAPGALATAEKRATKDPPWLSDADAAVPMFRMMVNRTITVEAGTRGSEAPNPDDAVLERARVTAGGCFASLAAGPGYGPSERSAHIVFTVVPSGTVSTTEVSSDTSDEGVLGCLRQQALSTAFSDNGGGPLRTYAIDVRVIAKGNSGGR